MYAGLFRFSMFLIDEGIIDISRTSDIFRVLFALVFAAFTAGSGPKRQEFLISIEYYKILTL